MDAYDLALYMIEGETEADFIAEPSFDFERAAIDEWNDSLQRKQLLKILRMEKRNEW